MTLGTGFYVGTNAAIPKQIDRGYQQRTDQFIGGHMIGIDGKALFNFRAELDHFSASRIDPRSGRKQRWIKILPTATGGLEQSPALSIGARRVGIWVDKNMQMIKRTDQLYVLRQQHAITKHITAHIADANNAKIFILNIDAEFAKVPTYSDPSSPRGNTHGLVIVTVTAA